MKSVREALRGLLLLEVEMELVRTILSGVACVLLGGLVFLVALRVGYREGYESGRAAAERAGRRERPWQ